MTKTNFIYDLLLLTDKLRDEYRETLANIERLVSNGDAWRDEERKRVRLKEEIDYYTNLTTKVSKMSDKKFKDFYKEISLLTKIIK